jgi:hypothetical protein
MKTKTITALFVAISMVATSTPCLAQQNEPLTMIADTVVVRPLCFAATAVGSVFFVVSLPFAAMSKSVKKTAHTLVVSPAKATFTRPVGDVDSLMDY